MIVNCNILGFEGEFRSVPNNPTRYLVSEFGTVYSIKYQKEKQAFLNNDGYYVVQLRAHTGVYSVSAHRLVAMAFLSNFSKVLEVNHINCIKTDNHYTNLEMVTHQENMTHAYAHKLIPTLGGVLNGRAKLTTSDVCEIRAFSRDIPDRLIASHYGISTSQINKIRNRSVGGWN